jgi:hypothetical protein
MSKYSFYIKKNNLIHNVPWTNDLVATNQVGKHLHLYYYNNYKTN